MRMSGRSRLKKLRDEKDKAFHSGEEIARKIDEDREQLKNFFESRKRKIETINNSRTKIEENLAEIKEKDGSLKRLRDDLEVVIKQLIDAIDKRKAEMLKSEEERQGVRTKIHESLKSLEDQLLEALRCIETGISEEALRILKTVDLEALGKNVTKFESYEDGFRSILFDKNRYSREEGRDR